MDFEIKKREITNEQSMSRRQKVEKCMEEIKSLKDHT